MNKLLKSFWILGIFLILPQILTFCQIVENNDERTELKIMTYNLKFASPSFKPSWEERREMQINLIRKYDPDIIGTQEGLKEQIDYLMDQLPEYIVVGEGRKGGDDDEHMAIFFKKEKFRLREMQSFQLSETPEIIGSGPDVNPRMVSWVRLAIINRSAEGEISPYPEDFRGHWENTKEFYIMNTHFFNGNNFALARLNASKLIRDQIILLERFGEWTDEHPVFLIGDFNCRPGSPPYKILTGDKGLMHDTSDTHNEIDWILYKGAVQVIQYEEIDYNEKGIYPSDHNPIYVKFKLID